MLRVWHPSLSDLEVEALSWIFKCLDDPALLAPAAEVSETSARATARAKQVPAKGGSRQERRLAAKAAKKKAKKAATAGFG